MKREAYEIHLTVVDANGTTTIDPKKEGDVLNSYPKVVDSKSYNNDLEKTLRRAYGLLGYAEYSMSTQDTRQVQYATLVRVSDGLQLEKRKFGKLADLPDPEPEPEPEEV